MKTFLWVVIVVLVLVALFVVVGRKKEGGTSPLTLSHGASALTISPEAASPGMVVRVTTAQPAFSDATTARVTIGGQPTTIVKLVSATEVDVLVPNVAAGESQLKVRGGKVSGVARFTVLPASAQELVLQLKDGKFELMAVHPTADEPNAVAPSQEPQLSYDLVNAQGGLVFTGSIDNPALARMELFDGPNAREATLRREPRHSGQPVVFTLKVPIVPHGSTVKFYEAAPQVNLLDATARQNRKPVGEIKLEK